MTVENNKKQQQFEIKLDGEIAQLTYRFRKKTMFLMHTTVPEAFKGKGVGSLLAKTALEYAKDKGHKIAVLCPFVSSYVKKNPDWYEYYDTDYHRIPPKPIG